jgi:hypothetical protein
MMMETHFATKYVCSAAERRKNEAHGVSRGEKGELTKSAPKERKKLPHTSANLLVHLIFSTKEAPVDYDGNQSRLVCVHGRHHSRNAWDGAHRERH